MGFKLFNVVYLNKFSKDIYQFSQFYNNKNADCISVLKDIVTTVMSEPTISRKTHAKNLRVFTRKLSQKAQITSGQTV
jgi:hypothetical protein